MKKLIDQAHKDIKIALREGKNPVIAFSGGKDALTTAHMLAQHGVTNAVCELSHYYAKVRTNIVEQQKFLDINVEYYDSLDDEWVRKHPQIIFSNDTKIRAWTFLVRQQRTVARHAKKHGHDMIAFGRRTQENSVPKILYKNKVGWSFHPLRNWRTEHVWEYLDMENIPIPWVYSTEHGRTEGNSPFYTLESKSYGGVKETWEVVTTCDPTMTPERYGIKL